MPRCEARGAAASHVSDVDAGVDLVQVSAGPPLCPHQPLELRGRGGFVPAAVRPLEARPAVEASGHVRTLLFSPAFFPTCRTRTEHLMPLTGSLQ